MLGSETSISYLAIVPLNQWFNSILQQHLIVSTYNGTGDAAPTTFTAAMIVITETTISYKKDG